MEGENYDPTHVVTTDLFPVTESPLAIGGPDYVRSNPGVAGVYLTITLLACVVGTLGNLGILGAVILNRNLHHSRNAFIVNLAFADLCVTAFADPFGVIGMLRGKAYFDTRPILCDFLATICLTACVAALFSIGGVGFNRYLHICHSNLYPKVFNLRNNIIYCMGFWVVGVVMSLPGLLGWTDNVYDDKYLECIWNRLHSLSFTIFFSVCIVFTPVCIITFSYVRIFLHVHASKRRIEQMKSSQAASSHIKQSEGRTHTGPGEAEPAQKNTSSSSSVKLARTLFVIFLVFVACWTPYALLVISDFNDQGPKELHLFILLLAHMHSTLNCIVYALTNNHFRVGYSLVLQKLSMGKVRMVSGTIQLATPTKFRSKTHQPVAGNGTTVQTIHQ